MRREYTALWLGMALLLGVGGTTTIAVAPAEAETSQGQITVLYDAFGKTSTMDKDWGFSAFIEYGGKRILFDTGNNAQSLSITSRPKTSI